MCRLEKMHRVCSVVLAYHSFLKQYIFGIRISSDWLDPLEARTTSNK